MDLGQLMIQQSLAGGQAAISSLASVGGIQQQIRPIEGAAGTAIPPMAPMGLPSPQTLADSSVGIEKSAEMQHAYTSLSMLEQVQNQQWEQAKLQTQVATPMQTMWRSLC